MRGIVTDVFAELVDRKVIYLFAFVTLVALLVIFAGSKIETEFDMPGGERLESEALGGFLSDWLVRGFSVFLTILVFLGAMASAGLIPRMMEPGRAEYYLSKPVSRTRLLLGKVLAIWFAYGLLVVLGGTLSALFAALVLGFSELRIVILFGIYWVDFLVWTSIICLGGVLFRSGSGAIISAFLVWILQEVPGFLEWVNQLLSWKAVGWIQDAIYYLIPDTSAMGDIAVQLTVGREVADWMPLWHSLLFAVVMLYLAVRVFKARDY